MTNEEFVEFTKSNAKMPITNDVYSAMGLNGEAGEVAEWVKKVIIRQEGLYSDLGLTLNDLKLELGDVLHYVVRMATNRGWTLSDLMDANVEKLLGRGEWS